MRTDKNVIRTGKRELAETRKENTIYVERGDTAKKNETTKKEYVRQKPEDGGQDEI
ncbi:hypothetical protein [Succinimonas amylolytica]|uniref:hypothetical protein n=1 Tax=Succinimonas amylolytica TaxID=83769 RepID=UPI0003A23B53|nr:hypothetical protein [Succinimonas amylolytica]